jgi:predicted homoserine dehydrogenase-like protein
MIIIDRALKKRADEGRPIQVGLVGVGTMGAGVLNQIVNSVGGMEVAAIASRTVSRIVQECESVGVGEVYEVATLPELNAGIASSALPVTDDAMLLCESDRIDAIIDTTGSVEFGAQLALKAFECGKDLVSMNAELDATVGSILARRAEEAGVVYTLSDGDQPGIEMNLWRFVKSIGLEPLVCGNIKGLQDEYRNPTTQKGFAEKWGQNPYMVTSFADGSKVSMEQACVANATGMQVEMRGMRGGDFEGHVDELCHSGRYDIVKLRELGGVVDYTVKSTPGPGVFVLATHDDPKQKHKLDLYKLGPGPLYCFYTPYHLCHFEVPLSVARVVDFGDAVLQAQSPKVDVITIAKKELKAGETLDAIGGYMTYGQCENYPVVRRKNLLPQGLAEGGVLKCDIPKDAAISYDDVDLPSGRLCDQLREEQNLLFPV